MQAKRILFASTLKPVDDIRMFKKLGMSLRQNEELELHFVGFPSTRMPISTDKIHFHPFRKFKRLSLFRLVTPWILLLKAIKLKPELLILNSTEYLLFIIPYRIILGDKIVYDIQENHLLNIKHQSVYPTFVKHILAHFVRLLERFSAPFIKHYLLAETCYTQQLPFTKGRSTILENKSLKTSLKTTYIKNTNKILLFSGTVSTEFGVFESIHLLEKLQQTDPTWQLIIIGQCKNKRLAKNLQEYQIKNPSLSLQIPPTPIPHESIAKTLKKASFAVLTYQTTPCFDGKIPTKLFEYMSHKLPMICFEDHSFKHLIVDNHAGVVLNRNLTDVNSVFTSLETEEFYDCKQTINPHWDSENTIFNKITQVLISN